ncbi:MAG: hypothetical protein JST92_01755 [Deltaproteobacteria bacterium]|nr:hypothetical protein [Deltaproteobacteria bacterium]
MASDLDFLDVHDARDVTITLAIGGVCTIQFPRVLIATKASGALKVWDCAAALRIERVVAFSFQPAMPAENWVTDLRIEDARGEPVEPVALVDTVVPLARIVFAFNDGAQLHIEGHSGAISLGELSPASDPPAP